MIKTLHLLSVLTPAEATSSGFVSISSGIHSALEKNIFQSIAQHRDPERFAWIQTGPETYELARLKSDIIALPTD